MEADPRELLGLQMSEVPKKQKEGGWRDAEEERIRGFVLASACLQRLAEGWDPNG